MASTLLARLCRLEAKYPEPNPFEEFTDDQLGALLLFLDSRPEAAEVSDETLWHNGMTREGYEAALNSISDEMFERLTAWTNKNHR